MTMQMNFTDAFKRTLFQKNPLAWMPLHGRAKTKAVDPEAWKRPLKPNTFQERIGEAIAYCKEQKVAARIIILKPRQRGSSTASCEVLYTESRLTPITGFIVGGLAEQYENLWKIMDHYHKGDDFKGWGNEFTMNTEVAKCTNKSEIKCGTAGNVNVGRGSTIHFLLCTELAHWPVDGAKSAADAMHSIMACVPQNEPGTTIIIESTGNGPGGLFHDTFAAAVDFKDFKAGKKGNGFIRVEAFWYEFRDCVKKDLSADDARNYRQILKDSGDTEAILMWNRMPWLEPAQIAWYHEILASPECNGDLTKRKRNHPATRQDAFSASNPSVFDDGGLTILETDAAKYKDQILYARLEQIDTATVPSVVFCSEQEAEIMLVPDWRPQIGFRHSCSVDNMTGESNVTGADPDTNSVMIIRDGYMMEGIWHPPEPIICTMPLNRWNNKPLAVLIRQLSRLFNNALAIPESNRGEGIITELREMGVPMLQRPRPATEVDHSKPSGKYGFATTAQSKPSLVSCLAGHIQNPTTDGYGLRIRFEHILNQLRSFVRHKNGDLGALEAMGCYDDAVIALGIGLMFRSQGTMYSVPRITVPLPRDIQVALTGDQDRRQQRAVW